MCSWLGTASIPGGLHCALPGLQGLQRLLADLAISGPKPCGNRYRYLQDIIVTCTSDSQVDMLQRNTTNFSDLSGYVG